MNGDPLIVWALIMWSSNRTCISSIEDRIEMPWMMKSTTQIITCLFFVPIRRIPDECIRADLGRNLENNLKTINLSRF